MPEESSDGSTQLNFAEKDHEYLAACVKRGDYAA